MFELPDLERGSRESLLPDVYAGGAAAVDCVLQEPDRTDVCAEIAGTDGEDYHDDAGDRHKKYAGADQGDSDESAAVAAKKMTLLSDFC